MTPWIAAHQASLSITNSWSLPIPTWGVPLSVSYHFAFSYSSWGSHEEYWSVCHSLLQWTTFCQTSPPWPAHLGWPHMAWLSFIELDKSVVRVIRLTSFLWLWFQCVCPLMLSWYTYRLAWVSVTLDVGYLFMAAPEFKLVLEKAEEP